MDVSRFSGRFRVRRLDRADLGQIYALCSGNPLYYRYRPPFVTEESLLEDMAVLPPNKEASDKYYVGYFDGGRLLAVMDLILAWPDDKTAFIGFFMTEASRQNAGLGSLLIDELCAVLCGSGFERIRLGWVKGNPQASHFWRKNRFVETGESRGTDSDTILIAERRLQSRGEA